MTEETIFLEAVEKSTPAERAAFLDEACAGDATLRERVEALLQSHADADFLETPAVQRAAEVAGGAPVGGATEAEAQDDDANSALDFLAPSENPKSLGRLGHYEIQEVIGRGGMGIVLRAFDEKLHRVVAIKVMAAQLATNATARKRFTREAQAQAAVSHDHIVTIHAVEDAVLPSPLGGEGPGVRGWPYLVMQYISGMSLQERLDKSGPLELHEILRIGMQTASALAAAHAQGLIHRDIKPANILLENGVERVKITDFGLARAATEASLTQSGVIAGTPQYMSPEQAEGKAIDQRTDLFSLGSVLYAMCTGRAPFRASGSMAVLKRVCEETPRPIRETNPDIPDWLIAVIDKLHAKDPAQRYQSAAEVADLLSRHLAHVQHPSVVGQVSNLPGEPKAGCKPAPRRRRWAIAAAVLLCVVAGFSLTEATGVTNLRATVIRILTPDGTLVVEVDDPGVKVTIEGDGGLVITGAGPQEVRLKPGSYRVQATKDGKPARVDRELVTITRSGKPSVKVSVEATPQPQAPPLVKFKPPPPGPLDQLDPAKIPAAERFDWQPKELVQILGEHRGRHWNSVYSVAFSPDEKLVASAGRESVIRLWDAETLRERGVLKGHGSVVTSVVFSADSRRLLSASCDGTLRVWDAATLEELQRLDVHSDVQSAAFSPDGRRALSASNDKLVRLWDLDTGKEIRRFEGHTEPIVSVVFSPDGRHALSAGWDNILRLWDIESGKELRRFEGHSNFVRSAAFSPDGLRILSGSDDKTVRLWDTKTAKELRRFEGHTQGVTGVAFAPDGRQALSASFDGTVRLWEVETGKEVRQFDAHFGAAPQGHLNAASAVTFSPNGRRAASGGWDCAVRLWDVRTGKELQPVRGHAAGPLVSVAFSPDGGRLLSSGTDLTPCLWNVQSGLELRHLKGHTSSVQSVVFSPDGGHALTGSVDGTLRLWELETGKELRCFRGHTGIVQSIRFSPDGRQALSGSRDFTVRLWDAESGRDFRRLDGHTGEVWGVAFSPDSLRALSGSSDKTARLWDLHTGRELHRFEHPTEVYSVAFSLDGRYAFTGSADGTVRAWDLSATPPPARSFFKWHTSPVRSLAVAPGGKTLATCGDDGRVILWDVAAGDKLREWQLPGWVLGVAFAPDGRHLATANANGTMYILRLAALSSGQNGADSKAEAPPPEPKAFVLLGGKSVAERKFDTLAEAVQGTSAGDIIEIRGNGPFVCDPIKITQALRIRASEGFRPVIKLSSDGLRAGAPLLESEAALVLEGLELQRMAQDPKEGGPHYKAVLTTSKDLHVANCRFLMRNTSNCIYNSSPVSELRNCEFLRADYHAGGMVMLSLLQSGQRLVIDNCLLTDFARVNTLEQSKAKGAAVQLTRNTFRTRFGAFWFYQVLGKAPSPKDLDQRAKVLRIETSGNIFDASFVIQFEQDPPEKRLPTRETAIHLAHTVGWVGERNLYAVDGPFGFVHLDTTFEPTHTPVKNLVDWRRFWATAEANSIEGRVRFQGGDLLAKLVAAPEQVTSEDFRLRPDSAGYKAGKDGKDLGADVDLVGPGPAYERWKKTPEYQQWLKDTKHVTKAEATKPVLRMHFDKADFYEKDGKTYVRDHSGKGNDGLCEQVQFTPEGKTGGGLANGGKGFLRLPTSLVANRPHFTITAWAKRTNPENSWAVYSCMPKDYPTTQLPCFNLFCTNHIYVGAWNLESDWLHVTDLNTDKSAGEWVFVAVTLENGAPGKGRLQLMLNDGFAVRSLQEVGRVPFWKKSRTLPP